MSQSVIPVLPLPDWYSPRDVADPFFSINPAYIDTEATAVRSSCGVPPASKDTRRVFRLNVDPQPGFTWPLTLMNRGIVTRSIAEIFRDSIEVPVWWEQDDNHISWCDGVAYRQAVNGSRCIKGGSLSVPGAWNDTRTICEWDLKNLIGINAFGNTRDSHAMTSIFDMHFWESVRDSEFGPKGIKPYLFMQGPTVMYPVVQKEMVWHPTSNPDGLFRPRESNPEMVDYAWQYAQAMEYIVLWNAHCQNGTFDSTLDPMFYAVQVYHNRLRGTIESEPMWFTKGISWKTEYFGGIEPNYDTGDEHSRKNLEIVETLTGSETLKPFDLQIVSGQAGSHCVPQTIQQEIKYLRLMGREDCIGKIVWLYDTSAIIPGFEEETKAIYDQLAKDGVQLVKSSDFSLTG